MPNDTFSRIFTGDVVEQLRAAAETDTLLFRVLVMTLERPFRVPWIPAQRSAWESYVDAADHCGLFDDPHGKDLIARLTSVEDDQFRPAMAECHAAWYLSVKLGLDVSPRPAGGGRSELEFLVKLPDGDVHVEVKAPWRVGIADGMVHTLDDSPALDQCLADASKQLSKHTRNLVMLVGRLVLDIHTHRRPLVKAFYAEEYWIINKLTGEASIGFKHTGRFLKVWRGEAEPRHRRIGGVLFLQDVVRSSMSPEGDEVHRIDNDALMLHNPNAHHPLPETAWGDCPQLVPRGENLEWTDGYPVGGPVDR